MRRSKQRPSWPLEHRYVVAVLLFGSTVGAVLPYYFFAIAEVLPLAWDFRAYHHAAMLARHGRAFVGAEPSVGAGEFVYQPITVVAFYPYSAISWSLAYAVQTALSVAAAIACCALIVAEIRDAGVTLSRFDVAAISGFVLASAYPMVVYGQGQIDFFVLLALIVCYRSIRRDRPLVAGCALAFACVFKLLPAFLLLWLARLRAWRTIAATVAASVAALLAGLWTFGFGVHRNYLRFLPFQRSRVGNFEHVISPHISNLTVHRPLAVLPPSLDARVYTAIATAALLPLLGVLYGRFRTKDDEMIAYLGTLVVMLVVSPAANAHHVLYVYFPLLPLLYTVRPGSVRSSLLAGTAILSFPVQPGQIVATLAVLGLPTTVVSAVMRVVRPVLVLGSVPLYGLFVVFVGCLLHRYRSRRSVTPRFAVADD